MGEYEMKIALKNGIILDGSKDMSPQKGKTIFIKDDIIEKIAAEEDISPEYKIVDLNGQYIMPGLINMHVHLPASGKPMKKSFNPLKMTKLITSNRVMRRVLEYVCESSAKTELLSGVTTLRTVGGIENYDAVIRDRIINGKSIGSRILASNVAISVEGGHMAGSCACIATSAEDAKKLVHDIAEGKPDLIKLMITGGVLDAKVKGEPGALKMPADYVKAACDEAHRLGFRVAAHTESTEGMKVALQNGVDSIEHGAEPTEEIIQLFKQRGASLITTISPTVFFTLIDPAITNATEEQQFNGNMVFNGIVECAKQCLEAGIPVGLGTDTGCPYVTHYNMWRELEYFHTFCGVSNSFALYTATKRNAEILGMGDKIGTIQIGKYADLIVTKNNPLIHLEALRNLSMVVSRGQIFTEIKVKKIKGVDTVLDGLKIL